MSIDLKSTLAIAVTTVISIGCAFIFVTKIYNSKDVYDITNVADASSINDSESAPKENIEANPEKNEDKKEKSKDKKEEGNTKNSEKSSNALSKILVPMDSIVVNLGKIDSRRYLRVLISLEVDNIETEKEVKKNKERFRDKLISFLSTKSPKEIGSPSNQSLLRTKIKDLLNKEFFKAAEVITKVYFSDLIIQ
ncbi:MAG: hypothetical protein HOL31_20345 [Candidatus Scalindua sp.]|nr:hypothetical protein [Candidatus Scalindua sp.]